MQTYCRLVIVILSFGAGCQGSRYGIDRSQIDQGLDERMGRTVGASAEPGSIILPQGMALEDTISDDAAIAIALWNNAQFQELLVDLKLTNADLIQAGLLPNPEIFFSFAVQDKVWKYLFDFPAESLWLRPIRIKAAERDNARVVQRLTQSALDLIRDVRQSYADTLMAHERWKIAKENVALRTNIAKLVAIRLENGDASAQEASTARIDLLQATQEATRIEYDIPVAEERLRNLMGIGRYRGKLTLEPPDPQTGNRH